MFILLPLLHKLPLRGRRITARILLVVGAIGTVVGAVAVHPVLFVSAVVLAMGIVLCGSVYRDTRGASRIQAS